MDTLQNPGNYKKRIIIGTINSVKKIDIFISTFEKLLSQFYVLQLSVIWGLFCIITFISHVRIGWKSLFPCYALVKCVVIILYMTVSLILAHAKWFEASKSCCTFRHSQEKDRGPCKVPNALCINKGCFY